MSRLAHDDVGLASIARDLAMSVRTLQRRLTADGCKFEELVDRPDTSGVSETLSDSR